MLTTTDQLPGTVRLSWDHGSAEVQTLGAMLGPVSLRLDHERELEVMHVAPWSGTTGAAGLPGMLRRLRGEWPCVPFGRADRPRDLPEGWTSRSASDAWAHGFSANHHWSCLEAGPTRVHLGIDYPEQSPVARMERIVEADPNAPALTMTLRIWARTAARVPAGLHPTFRIPGVPGRVQVELGQHEGIFSYPANPPGAISRLLPDTRSDCLRQMAGVDGMLDLSHLPLAAPSEELLQVKGLSGSGNSAPFMLRYLDYGAAVGMWWDREQLPDLMLWISNGGRINYPWMSRHLALGAEPVNSLFDLGRVADAPPGHALADRLGLMLSPERPWQTSYRIAAWHDAAP